MSRRVHMVVPAYLPPKAARERYGWSDSTFYRLLGDGMIKAKKDGRNLMVEIASCDAYVASLPDAKIRPDKHRSRLGKDRRGDDIECPSAEEPIQSRKERIPASTAEVA
jgi:hypothetical protein